MGESIRIDRDRIDRTEAWVHERGEVIVTLINRVRDDLGDLFDTDVEPVTKPSFQEEVDVVFADPDSAVNIVALIELLRAIDVEEDYPGFIVDEFLGRELAAIIAGEQPLRLLAEATFHFADVKIRDHPNEGAGLDDLDAALAAGFQTRLPGWSWRTEPAPFETEGAND